MVDLTSTIVPVNPSSASFLSTPPPIAQAAVIVGMSGGVDSSLSAALLREAGYDVSGLFMKNWDEDDGTEYCTAQQDLEDAQAVCKHLGIRLHEANFAAEYWDNVFAHFLREYQAGRTPNPDVLCNREIKFNVFAEYAGLLGAEFIATGHYARLDHREDQTRLLKGVDRQKDQSYFLQSVSAEQLKNCLFPIGGMEKHAVRSEAQARGLPVFDKKDSTGICFIGERRFRDFLENYLPKTPGAIVDTSGREIGRHEGLVFYTIGQRQGLGIGGIANSSEAPWYVVDKQLTTDTLVVAQGNDHPALFSRQLDCADVHWVSGETPQLPDHLHAKIRYRQADQRCELAKTESGYTVTFEQPQRAVTEGQWVCFYDNDVCLGGGVIEARR